MQFILVIMFFVTPPTLGKNRLWALQSTQSVEFDSWKACDDAIRNAILPAIKSTDTMALSAWCLPKSFKGAERKSFLAQPGADKAKAMENYGSCYEYVPAPVTGRQRQEGTLTDKPVSKCH
jgi:hypothetical protein